MGAVAAVVIARQKHVVAAFQRARATAAAAAVVPADIGVAEHLAFEKLRRHGVLREADAGRFYLDEPTWNRIGRLRVTLVLLVVLIGLACVAWVMTR